jgi:carboxymethylenebutenolidase
MKQFAPGLAPQTQDVEAAVEWLQSEMDGNVGVVGYCFGGTMAWVSACRLPIQAAVGYYGGNIAELVHEEPQCPIMLHFGADDPYIPVSSRDAILQAHPEVPVFVYENAGHAFNRKLDPTHYNLAAATLAKKRSLLFFEQHLVF